MDLKDLKIIVTGGAGGMGAHFATRLAEAGAQVAVGDVNDDGLAALVESTKGAPGSFQQAVIDSVARVTHIATRPEYTPPVLYNRENRSKLVFMIEATFSPADARDLHPGQPVDVTR